MNRKIKVLIEESQEHMRKWEEQRRQHEEEHLQSERYKRYILLPCLTTRNVVSKYKDWLKGFMANGGKPTHYYNYSMPDSWYVATQNIVLQPLFGAQAIDIICPVGIEIEGPAGHSKVFFLDGFRARSNICIPVYRNTIV